MKINIKVDERDMESLDERLGGLENCGPELKTAINKTARMVQKSLSDQAGRVYRYKGGKAAIRKDSKIQKATAARPEATVQFISKTHEIKDFHVSSMAVSRTQYTPGGRRRSRTIKGAVLKSGGSKALQGKSGKAFVVQFKSEHVSVVTRDPDEIADKFQGKKLTKHTQKLRVWRSPSTPTMAGNEKVYGKLQPDILEEMHTQVQNVIEKVIYG